MGSCLSCDECEREAESVELAELEVVSPQRREKIALRHESKERQVPSRYGFQMNGFAGRPLTLESAFWRSFCGSKSKV